MPRTARTSFNSSSASSPTQVPECLRIARAEERRGTGLMPDLTLFRPDCFLGSKRSPNDFTLAVAPVCFISSCYGTIRSKSSSRQLSTALCRQLSTDSQPTTHAHQRNPELREGGLCHTIPFQFGPIPPQQGKDFIPLHGSASSSAPSLSYASRYGNLYFLVSSLPISACCVHRIPCQGRKGWWRCRELNPGHCGYEPHALTI